MKGDAQRILTGLLTEKHRDNYEKSYGQVVVEELVKVFDQCDILKKHEAVEYTLKDIGLLMEQNDRIIRMLLLLAFYLACTHTTSVWPRPGLGVDNAIAS